jgi:AmiR/NasT family two-component response regulator
MKLPAKHAEVNDLSSARFLRSAQLCRIRDLTQLLAFSDLISEISELIHALQKERGASSIYLGSNGAKPRGELISRVSDSLRLECAVRSRLVQLDETLDRMSCGARYHSTVAVALRDLDALPALRDQVAATQLAPLDAVKAFTDTINGLLSVICEVAGIAADPKISQAMLALVNFSQAKEFAGQERATAAAGFARASFEALEIRRLYYLTGAQDQGFQLFRAFADPTHVEALREIEAGPVAQQIEAMRKVAFAGGQFGDLNGITAESWFELATARIDAMRAIECALSANLRALCKARLSEVHEDGEAALSVYPTTGVSSVAVMVSDADPAQTQIGLDGGVALYSANGAQPGLMRSILDVVRDQSRRIHDVTNKLESARGELNDRKAIDRAKALLMSSRNLSEQEAYTLLRKTAMNQHKRMAEVAYAVLGMADILNLEEKKSDL